MESPGARLRPSAGLKVGVHGQCFGVIEDLRGGPVNQALGAWWGYQVGEGGVSVDLRRGPASFRRQARERRDRLLQVFHLADDLVGPGLERPGEVQR